MKLPLKSLEFLRACLAEPGWSPKGDSPERKLQLFYLSGKLLAETLPEVPEVPFIGKTDDPVRLREYSKLLDTFYKQEVDLTLTDKDFETCQTCLRFMLTEDRMPKGVPGLALMTAFKLIPTS